MSTLQATGWQRAAAWSVHLYTALGVVLALGALSATVEGDVRTAFLWMSLAVVIDATDGTFARAARVKEVVPDFDGARLDDIVDYLNYVLVPVFFAYWNGMFPVAVALPAAALPLVASAYGFCQTAAKTGDFFFTGFPSYWNVVVFYLYGLGSPPPLSAAVMLGFAALVFVPIGYIYPSRQPFLRPVTVGLGVVWGVLIVAAVFQLPRPSTALLAVSLFYPAYYFALSFYLHFRRRQPG